MSFKKGQLMLLSLSSTTVIMFIAFENVLSIFSSLFSVIKVELTLLPSGFQKLSISRVLLTAYTLGCQLCFPDLMLYFMKQIREKLDTGMR